MTSAYLEPTRESGRSFTRASLQLGVVAALILAVYTAFSAAGHAL